MIDIFFTCFCYQSEPNKLYVYHITSKACVAGYVNSIDGTTFIASSDEEGGNKPVNSACLKKMVNCRYANEILHCCF